MHACIKEKGRKLAEAAICPLISILFFYRKKQTNQPTLMLNYPRAAQKIAYISQPALQFDVVT